jgi:spore coat polysaccharide biosynthesis protein SpsF
MGDARIVTAVILQARLDSSRLPNKALLPLGGEPMIFRVMEALRAIPCDAWALACPADAEAAFAPLADRAGFRLVIGSKEDVLGRYCAAVRFLGADRVIRATGDNPFVFPDAAAAIAREGESCGADYAAYAGLPYGAGVEAVAAEALLRAEREATLPSEREHVCPYLYTHGDLFILHRPAAPVRWRRPSVRLTVDTAEDYEAARRLFDALAGPRTAFAAIGWPVGGEAVLAAHAEVGG